MSFDEVEKLDRDWDAERQRYMITTKYGRRYVPSTGAAVVVGLFSVSLGLIWMMTTLALAQNFGAPRGRTSAVRPGIRRRRPCNQLLPVPKGGAV